ncbi:hypothetical protein [Actinopolymorpha cephalotaxi]|nr:hypothetical protein [Actinopolymorpha cephalotaxi]NYH86894.1 hypothetical protein [Actinopolymorpha cephalotaxi]
MRTRRLLLVAVVVLALFVVGKSVMASQPAGGGDSHDAARPATPGPQLARSGVIKPAVPVVADTGAAKAAPDPPSPSADPQTQKYRRTHSGDADDEGRQKGSTPTAVARPVTRPDVSDELGPPLPGPPGLPVRTVSRPVGEHRGEGPRGPDRLSVFRNTTVPVTTGRTGAASEPSTDQSGRNIFATGNYHAEFSRDSGATWTGLDPFTLFGPGFCCDQVTAYDPGRNRQYWILQYLPSLLGGPGFDHLTLANSAGGDFVHWCPYVITPRTFGRPKDESFDFNDLVVGTRYLYLTSRFIRVQDRGYTVVPLAMVARISLNDLARCRPAHYDVVLRTDLRLPRVAQGITDVAYAASTSPAVGQGRNLRMLVWPENTRVVRTVDRRVPPYIHISPASGAVDPNCASEDGKVNNWCEFVDSDVLGAARGNGYLWFSWSARQYGARRPFPYTRITKLRESDLRVLDNRDVYSKDVAHVYASLAPDGRGHVGLVDSFGGGTGRRHVFPGGMVGVFDDLSPRIPSVNYFLRGHGGGCTFEEGSSSGRWGDYLSIRGWPTGDGVWNATTYVRDDNSPNFCPDRRARVTIKNVAFGRERDRGNYERFANS